MSNVSKSFRVAGAGTGFLGALSRLVSPKYSTVRAVERVDLIVGRGEIVGYIGPNGAGKSTTIKMIAGIMAPTSGEVAVLGKNPFLNRVETQLKLGIMLGQRSRLFWDLPAIESFKYFSLVYRVEKASVKTRIAETIEAFNLSGFVNVPVRQLSLGQKMRCDIALNLLHRPAVLLLDEPTVGLDIEAKRAAREAIRAAAKEFGAGVLLTSHDLSDVERLSDRVVILNQGRVLFDDTLAKLRESHKVGAQMQIVLFEASDPLTEHLKIVNGIASVTSSGASIDITFDPAAVGAAQIMSEIVKFGTVLDFKVSEPPVEELVERFYNSDPFESSTGDQSGIKL